MEERVLSYQLSQELSVEEIKQVSGAGHTSTGPSAGGTYDNLSGIDGVHVDYTWDF